MVANIQLYDRHIDQAKIMLERSEVDCQPKVWINPDKRNFYDMTVDDVKIIDYPRDEIKKVNPQLKFDLGV
jgi:thymidylate synthase